MTVSMMLLVQTPVAIVGQIAPIPPIPPIPPTPQIPEQVFVHTGMPGDIPQGAATVAIAFFLMIAFIAVGLPLVRALARRWDRQPDSAARLPSDLTARLERIEQAVEAVAVEVERISEGQRFTTKLLNEMRALPPGNALAQQEVEQIASPRGDKVNVERNA